jgi:hypothetical protein
LLEKGKLRHCSTEAAAAVCERALDRVDAALENHRAGRPEDFSVGVLENVRCELVQMASTLDKDRFRPSYPRFILDWPDDHGLVEYLLRVSHDYRRWT